MTDPGDGPLERWEQRRDERPRPAARWRRRAVIAGVTAVLLAGGVWHVVSRYAARPRLTVVSSRSAIVGVWRLEGGRTGRVEFAADGRFSAVGLPIATSVDGFTGQGKWSLDNRGGLVALRPDHHPSDMEPDASLGVVRADGGLRLCVGSNSPGVLCDALLGPATAPR
ncbi:hypothetical protein ACIP4Y_21960 [Streptomyces sp. NPDC088810]|uniref:hypothetical protein n=1 Tax=Streptomyces sp. NPDC088810 TaxID=3365904 RepID=UPI0038199A60